MAGAGIGSTDFHGEVCGARCEIGGSVDGQSSGRGAGSDDRAVAGNQVARDAAGAGEGAVIEQKVPAGGELSAADQRGAACRLGVVSIDGEQSGGVLDTQRAAVGKTANGKVAAILERQAALVVVQRGGKAGEGGIRTVKSHVGSRSVDDDVRRKEIIENQNTVILHDPCATGQSGGRLL